MSINHTPCCSTRGDSKPRKLKVKDLNPSHAELFNQGRFKRRSKLTFHRCVYAVSCAPSALAWPWPLNMPVAPFILLFMYAVFLMRPKHMGQQMRRPAAVMCIMYCIATLTNISSVVHMSDAVPLPNQVISPPRGSKPTSVRL